MLHVSSAGCETDMHDLHTAAGQNWARGRQAQPLVPSGRRSRPTASCARRQLSMMSCTCCYNVNETVDDPITCLLDIHIACTESVTCSCHQLSRCCMQVLADVVEALTGAYYEAGGRSSATRHQCHSVMSGRATCERSPLDNSRTTASLAKYFCTTFLQACLQPQHGSHVLEFCRHRRLSPQRGQPCHSR